MLFTEILGTHEDLDANSEDPPIQLSLSKSCFALDSAIFDALPDSISIAVYAYIMRAENTQMLEYEIAERLNINMEDLTSALERLEELCVININAK